MMATCPHPFRPNILPVSSHVLVVLVLPFPCASMKLQDLGRIAVLAARDI